MQNSVAYELTVFGGAGAAGVIIAFLYDMFRLKRRMVKTKAAMVHFEDILFWLIAAIIFFLSSYIISNGETRAYYYAGTLIGGTLYFSILSQPVIWLLTATINILLWPVMKLVDILKPILIIIVRCIKKLLKKIRNQIAIESYKARVDFNRLKNTFLKK
ncbi:MAG: spore cortex biosynthesis protein YabQ [Acetivibrionales bacterium]|jgi:spore cortex biosynthesis protein YabQ